MTNQMKPIKFAVLGCGKISGAHVRAIHATEGAELAAVCDNDEARAKAYGEEHGVRYYSDYEEMLAADDIDVICICTPSSMHPEQTIKAAEAGKHVVCEKPLAIHMDDFDRMVEACRRHGVKLASIFPRRMSPAAQFVKSLVDDGRLGKLSLCSGYIKFYRTQAYYDSAGWRGTWSMDGGGAMMNQGIHTIDLLQWLAGEAASLAAYTDHVLRDIEVEDTAVVALRYRSGALGVIEATTTAHNQPDHQIVLHGDNGTVILTGDEITTLDLRENPIDMPDFGETERGHTLQIKDMVQAIREDRDPIVTGEDARHSLEIILGSYESSREKREYYFKN